jgi:hypothetical protein
MCSGENGPPADPWIRSPSSAAPGAAPAIAICPCGAPLAVICPRGAIAWPAVVWGTIAARGTSPAPSGLTRAPPPPRQAEDALQTIAPSPVAWLGLSLGNTTRAAGLAGQELRLAGGDHWVMGADAGSTSAAGAARAVCTGGLDTTAATASAATAASVNASLDKLSRLRPGEVRRRAPSAGSSRCAPRRFGRAPRCRSPGGWCR